MSLQAQVASSGVRTIKIFISCPREFVGQLPALRAALKAQRIDARTAQDIASADLWFESIGKELSSAGVFVFVVSEGGLDDWQQKELSRALEHTWADASKTLLVVTLGTSVKVPPAFAQSHRIVADGPQPDLTHLADQIAEAVRMPRVGVAETAQPDQRYRSKLLKTFAPIREVAKRGEQATPADAMPQVQHGLSEAARREAIEALLKQGEQQRDGKDNPQAIASLTAALKLARGLRRGTATALVARIHTNLATMLRQQGELVEAERHLKRAVGLYGEDRGHEVAAALASLLLSVVVQELGRTTTGTRMRTTAMDSIKTVLGAVAIKTLESIPLFGKFIGETPTEVPAATRDKAPRPTRKEAVAKKNPVRRKQPAASVAQTTKTNKGAKKKAKAKKVVKQRTSGVPTSKNKAGARVVAKKPAQKKKSSSKTRSAR